MGTMGTGDRGAWRTVDGEQHPRDLIAAGVLGAVTPPEADLVAAHLAWCADCRRLERELREVEARLPDLHGELEPPPRLKARLMDAVRAEPRGPTAPSGSDGHDEPSDRRAPTPIRPEPEPVRAPRRQRTFGGTTIGLLAVAAVLVLAVVGVGVWRLLGARRPTPTSVVALAGTSVQPAIKGSLSYYASDNRVELSVHGLRPLPSGRVYELWLIRGHYQVTKGLGAFRPSSSGTASLSAPSDALSHYTLACLTVEQAPRAQRPTLPLVALGNIG